MANTVKQGTYVILNAQNPNYALDSPRSLADDNGTRVQLWERLDSLPQLVQVMAYGSGYRLRWPMNGKSLDRSGGGTTVGTTVIQWDSEETNENQRWSLVDSGKTKAIGGTTYPLFAIKPTLAAASALCVSPLATAANGTQTALHAYAGDDDQLWAFVPQASVPDGTYAIITAMDPGIVLDIDGASTANGANCQVYARNYANSQTFSVENRSDGRAVIWNTATGKCLDVAGWVGDIDGANVQQWEWHDGDNQKWVIEPREGHYSTLNGNVVPQYVIHPIANKGKCLDVNGGGTQLETNVQVWPQNGADAQGFAFVPAQWIDTDLPSATGGALSSKVGGTTGTGWAAEAGKTFSLYPTWKGSAEAYQVRYRLRSRKVGQANATRTSWGPWKDVHDGSTANGGRGKVGVAADTYRDGDRFWCRSGIALTLDTKAGAVDRYDVEFEVVALEQTDRWGSWANGPAVVFSGRAEVKPSVTFSLGVVPEGLQVRWASSLARADNRMTLTCPLFGTRTWSGLAASGVVTVPLAELKAFPVAGELTELAGQFVTCDNAAASANFGSLAIAWGTGYSADATAKVVAAGMYASVTSAAGSTVWMRVERGHGDRFVKVTTTGGTTTCAPPLGRKVQFVVMRRVSESSFTGAIVTMPAIEACGYGITSLDMGREFWLFAGDAGDGGPGFEVSYKHSSDSVETTGREREVVTFGSTVTASWELSGFIMEDAFTPDVEEQLDAFDWVVHEGFAIFRGPRGFWAQVAVTSGKCDIGAEGSHEASVSCTEVEL